MLQTLSTNPSYDHLNTPARALAHLAQLTDPATRIQALHALKHHWEEKSQRLALLEQSFQALSELKAAPLSQRIETFRVFNQSIMLLHNDDLAESDLKKYHYPRQQHRFFLFCDFYKALANNSVEDTLLQQFDQYQLFFNTIREDIEAIAKYIKKNKPTDEPVLSDSDMIYAQAISAILQFKIAEALLLEKRLKQLQSTTPADEVLKAQCQKLHQMLMDAPLTHGMSRATAIPRIEAQASQYEREGSNQTVPTSIENFVQTGKPLDLQKATDAQISNFWEECFVFFALMGSGIQLSSDSSGIENLYTIAIKLYNNWLDCYERYEGNFAQINSLSTQQFKPLLSLLENAKQKSLSNSVEIAKAYEQLKTLAPISYRDFHREKSFRIPYLDSTANRFSMARYIVLQFTAIKSPRFYQLFDCNAMLYQLLEEFVPEDEKKVRDEIKLALYKYGVIFFFECCEKLIDNKFNLPDAHMYFHLAYQLAILLNEISGRIEVDKTNTDPVESALDTVQNHTKFHFYAAVIHWIMGDVKESKVHIKAYQDSLRKNPNHFPEYNELNAKFEKLKKDSNAGIGHLSIQIFKNIAEDFADHRNDARVVEVDIEKFPEQILALSKCQDLFSGKHPFIYSVSEFIVAILTGVSLCHSDADTNQWGRKGVSIIENWLKQLEQDKATPSSLLNVSMGAVKALKETLEKIITEREQFNVKNSAEQFIVQLEKWCNKITPTGDDCLLTRDKPITVINTLISKVKDAISRFKAIKKIIDETPNDEPFSKFVLTECQKVLLAVKPVVYSLKLLRDIRKERLDAYIIVEYLLHLVLEAVNKASDNQALKGTLDKNFIERFNAASKPIIDDIALELSKLATMIEEALKKEYESKRCSDKRLTERKKQELDAKRSLENFQEQYKQLLVPDNVAVSIVSDNQPEIKQKSKKKGNEKGNNAPKTGGEQRKTRSRRERRAQAVIYSEATAAASAAAHDNTAQRSATGNNQRSKKEGGGSADKEQKGKGNNTTSTVKPYEPPSYKHHHGKQQGKSLIDILPPTPAEVRAAEEEKARKKKEQREKAGREKAKSGENTQYKLTETVAPWASKPATASTSESQTDENTGQKTVTSTITSSTDLAQQLAKTQQALAALALENHTLKSQARATEVPPVASSQPPAQPSPQRTGQQSEIVMPQPQQGLPPLSQRFTEQAQRMLPPPPPPQMLMQQAPAQIPMQQVPAQIPMQQAQQMLPLPAQISMQLQQPHIAGQPPGMFMSPSPQMLVPPPSNYVEHYVDGVTYYMPVHAITPQFYGQPPMPPLLQPPLQQTNMLAVDQGGPTRGVTRRGVGYKRK